MTFSAQPMRFDVSDVIGEQASLAATYYPARPGTDAGAVLVCLAGGTYSRQYWDLNVPGHRGYSFADFATENGYAVLADSAHCHNMASSLHRLWQSLLDGAAIVTSAL
jgi:hypothetical protein